MRGFLLAAVMFGAASGAQAADMPDFLRGSLPAGPAPTVNWQGYYIGGQAGYGSSDERFQRLERQTCLPPCLTTTSSRRCRSRNGISVSASNRRARRHSVALPDITGNGMTSSSASRQATCTARSGVRLTRPRPSPAAPRCPMALPSSCGQFIGVDLDFRHGDVPRARRLRLGLFPALRVRRICARQCRHRALCHRPRRRQRHVWPGRSARWPTIDFATDAVHNHLIYGYTAGLGVDINLAGGLFLRAEWEYVRFTSAIDTSINTVRAGLGYKF